MSDTDSLITEEVRQFQQSFATGAKLDIVALTGSNRAAYSKMGDEQAWLATISITAWRVQDQEEIKQDEFILTNKGQQEQLEQLFSPMEANQLWKMTVRHDGKRLLLLALEQLLNPAQERELARVLEEQTREVNIEHERLGTFVLDRRRDMLRGTIEWLGKTVRVSIEQGEEVQLQLNHLTRLLDAATEWDERIRTFAAGELTELKNDSWLEEDEEEWSEDNFAKQLSLQEITFTEEDFTFWFDDGDLFWGHTVCVSNTIEDGPYDASMGG